MKIKIGFKPVFEEIWIRRVRGANFCQVEIIKPIWRLTPCKTSGNQKWRGANPSFKSKAKEMRVIEKLSEVWEMIHCPEINQFHEEAKMIVDEATACEIKYLAEDSKDRCEIGFIISGIMAIILISNPSHAINQLELNIVVVVPKKNSWKEGEFY